MEFRINRYCIILMMILSLPRVYSQEKMLPVGSYADEIEKRIALRDANRVGLKLPVFIADTFDGSVFNSTETKKITFYYFWYNCGEPCTGLFPAFNEIQKEYEGRADFISITYNKMAALEILEEQPFTFRHCVMDKDEIETLRLSVGYPTTIITVDGIIIYCKSGGPMDPKLRDEWKEEWKKIIDFNLG